MIINYLDNEFKMNQINEYLFISDAVNNLCLVKEFNFEKEMFYMSFYTTDEISMLFKEEVNENN